MSANQSHNGLFITFEGGEGAGKSSQINILAQKLQDRNYKVKVTREPGGTAGAEIIRHVLLSGNAEKLGADVETMLFAAARADHVDQIIRPALKKGKIVLSDRFFDSTRVYQGTSGKVDMAFIKALETISCGKLKPDLTLILDLSSQEGMKRASSRRKQGETADRFEKEAIQQQELRRKAFLEIARQEPNRCKVIDANGTLEQVADRVWDEVETKLKKVM